MFNAVPADNYSTPTPPVDDDPLNAARAMLIGVVIGLAFWSALAWLVIA